MNGVMLFKNTKMNKYLIDYENAHWCGGQLNVVVNAESESEALQKAEYHMEACQRELFAHEYEEDEEDEETCGAFDDECAYAVNSVEILDEDNEYWRFYKDPSQAEFYPEIY